VPGIRGGGVEEAVIGEWVERGGLLSLMRLLRRSLPRNDDVGRRSPRNDRAALIAVLWSTPKILPILV